MKINLTICGVDELSGQERKGWSHVVSIWDKRYLGDETCRDLIMNVAPTADHLFSFFEDTNDSSHPDAPRLRDVKRILAFTSELSARAKVLVHCRAGVSRSTAIAYAILCQHSVPGMETANLMHVESLRAVVYPNRLIIELADKVLKRNGGMLLHCPNEP